MSNIIDINDHRDGWASMKPGGIQWHCSEECGPADIGILLKLDDERSLWVGEISRSLWSEYGEDSAAIGSDNGWWIIIFDRSGDGAVIGKALNAETARTLVETLGSAMTGAAS